MSKRNIPQILLPLLAHGVVEQYKGSTLPRKFICKSFSPFTRSCCHRNSHSSMTHAKPTVSGSVVYFTVKKNAAVSICGVCGNSLLTALTIYLPVANAISFRSLSPPLSSSCIQSYWIKTRRNLQTLTK